MRLAVILHSNVEKLLDPLATLLRPGHEVCDFLLSRRLVEDAPSPHRVHHFELSDDLFRVITICSQPIVRETASLYAVWRRLLHGGDGELFVKNGATVVAPEFNVAFD